MSKSSKAIKYTVDRISSGVSSGLIVDQFEYKNRNLIAQLKNMAKTRFVCNTSESVFVDFKKSQFPEVARDKYYDVVQAYKRKDKVDLMKFLSVPLYDVFKSSLKTGQPLPFQLYDEIIDIKLIQARIYSNSKHATNASQTWHQMTCKYTFYDKAADKDVTRYNVLERREADKNVASWRMCHFE